MTTLNVSNRYGIRKDVFDELLTPMYHYQSQNNVVGKCIENCNYVHDILVRCTEVRVAPVFAIMACVETSTLTVQRGPRSTPVPNFSSTLITTVNHTVRTGTEF